MVKYHKIIAGIFGVLFFLLIQRFSNPDYSINIFVGAFALYGAVLTWYNYWYLRQMDKLNLLVLIRPLLFVSSAFLLSNLAPNDFLQDLFLIFASALVILFEIFLGTFAENMQTVETVLTAFGFIATAVAFRDYFPLRLWWSVISIFLALFLVVRCFYEFVPQSNRVKTLAALGIGLFMAELAWAMSLLPFHYSAIAVLLVSIFYFCLMMNYYAFFQVLDAKKIYFHILIMAISSGAVLLVTPWEIVE